MISNFRLQIPDYAKQRVMPASLYLSGI